MRASSPHSRLGRFAACIAAAGFLFAAAASAQTQLPPPSYGQADTRQDRIEELEGQLRDATAENERLQNQLNQAQREVQRLRGMVGELSSVNQSLQTAPAAPTGGAPAEATQPRQQAPAPAAATAQARQTGTLGTLPATQLPGEEGQAYSYARELLANGRNAEAEAAFAQFLVSFPSATTSNDARFLLAFTQLARNNYRDAAQNFIQYLRVTPQGPRAPEAQVRLGMAFAGLAKDGENDAAELRQACSAFASLPRQFPNAPRYVRDIAIREARAANCAA